MCWTCGVDKGGRTTQSNTVTQLPAPSDVQVARDKADGAKKETSGCAGWGTGTAMTTNGTNNTELY
jgi:hypothetical protein